MSFVFEPVGEHYCVSWGDVSRKSMVVYVVIEVWEPKYTDCAGIFVTPKPHEVYAAIMQFLAPIRPIVEPSR